MLSVCYGAKFGLEAELQDRAQASPMVTKSFEYYLYDDISRLFERSKQF